MSVNRIKTASVEALVNWYKELAISHGQATIAGDYKAANKAHDLIAAIYRELRFRGSDAQFALLVLLDDSNRRVRCWAAAHALEFAPDQGEKVLVEIAESEPGPTRLSAEMTIQEWRQGKLQFP